MFPESSSSNLQTDHLQGRNVAGGKNNLTIKEKKTDLNKQRLQFFSDFWGGGVAVWLDNLKPAELLQRRGKFATFGKNTQMFVDKVQAHSAFL